MSRSVSVHSNSAMMHYLHTGEAVVTTQKIDIFGFAGITCEIRGRRLEFGG